MLHALIWGATFCWRRNIGEKKLRWGNDLLEPPCWGYELSYVWECETSLEMIKRLTDITGSYCIWEINRPYAGDKDVLLGITIFIKETLRVRMRSYICNQTFGAELPLFEGMSRGPVRFTNMGTTLDKHLERQQWIRQHLVMKIWIKGKSSPLENADFLIRNLLLQNL